MISIRWAWMTGLIAALVATPAYSQHRESGDVYLGAAVGYHMAPDAEDQARRTVRGTPGLENAQVSIDDEVIGWGVYGGFAVTDGLALEAGWLGNADMETTTLWSGVDTRVDISSSAFYAAVVASFPMPQGSAVYPFVKAGMARWDAEATVNVGDDTVVSLDGDGTDPLFGVGVDVPGFGNLSFRGEYLILWIDDDDGGYQHRFQAGVNFTF